MKFVSTSALALLLVWGPQDFVSLPAQVVVSEWLPALTAPETFKNERGREELLMACGVMEATTIWIQFTDLNGDSKDERIVTLSLPAESAGARGSLVTSVTYVFRGVEGGRDIGHFGRETLWFSLVTDVLLTHVLGDAETRRQFTFQHQANGDVLNLHEVSSANNGGEGRDRFMQARATATRSIILVQLPKDRPLPLELDDRRR